MDRSSLRLFIVGKTDRGRQREDNEDNFYISPDENVFTVFDGLGGQLHGGEASSIAKQVFAKNSYLEITERIKIANRVIYQQLGGIGGTTATAASIGGNTLSLAHVGDSRAYLFRGETIKQLTNDHSWIQEQVDAGLLTIQQAHFHPFSNIIMRALGTDPSVVVDSYKYKLRSDDIVLLCTDGLTKTVEDNKIYQVVRQFPSLERAIDQLITLVNQKGGPDNITIVMCQFTRGNNREIKTG